MRGTMLTVSSESLYTAAFRNTVFLRGGNVCSARHSDKNDNAESAAQDHCVLDMCVEGVDLRDRPI